MWIIFVQIIFILYVIRLVIKSTYKKSSSKVCLIGKTAIVTGANAGIGYETALDLAGRGCKVILACRRDASKEVEAIIKETHNPHVKWKYVDLQSFDTVRKFCEQIHKEEDKLDILVNNAGIGGQVNVVTKDGYHPTMQTNLFSGFLITHLLVDLLKKPGSARIVFVSSVYSGIHTLTPSLEALNPSPNNIGWIYNTRLYGTSKVGQVLISNQYAKKLKRFGITSNAVHPGTVKTKIFEGYEDTNMSFFIKKAMYIQINLFFRSPEEGAQRVIEQAVSNKYDQKTGTFWNFSSLLTPKIVYNESMQESVWKRLEEYVALKPDEKI